MKVIDMYPELNQPKLVGKLRTGSVIKKGINGGLYMLSQVSERGVAAISLINGSNRWAEPFNVEYRIHDDLSAQEVMGILNCSAEGLEEWSYVGQVEDLIKR